MHLNTSSSVLEVILNGQVEISVAGPLILFVIHAFGRPNRRFVLGALGIDYGSSFWSFEVAVAGQYSSRVAGCFQWV